MIAILKADSERAIQLGELLIQMPNGIVLNFDTDNLIPFRDKEGFQSYSIIFPSTMSDLIRATHYDRFKSLQGYPKPLPSNK